MKITKRYLFKCLKNSVPDLYYKFSDMVFSSGRDHARLSTSNGFFPEYYVHCFFVDDIVEIRVHHNIIDDEGEYQKDLVIDRYGSDNSGFYKSNGWKELI